MEILIDRRAETGSRVSLNAPLEFTPEGFREPCEGDCVNLSSGGVSIRTPFVPAVGEDIVCRFEFSPKGQALEVAGRVVWAHEEGERGGRFGVRFMGLDGRSRAQIVRVLTARADERPGGSAIDGQRPAQLLLDGACTPISAHVAQRRGRLLTFEQELPLLQIGRGLSADIPGLDPITGRIASVDLRLFGDTPRLVVTVGVTSVEGGDIAPDIPTAQPPPVIRLAALGYIAAYTERLRTEIAPSLAKVRSAISAIPVEALGDWLKSFFSATWKRARIYLAPARRRRTTAAPPATFALRKTATEDYPLGIHRLTNFKRVFIGVAAVGAALTAIYAFSIGGNRTNRTDRAQALARPAVTRSPRGQRERVEKAPAPSLSVQRTEAEPSDKPLLPQTNSQPDKAPSPPFRPTGSGSGIASPSDPSRVSAASDSSATESKSSPMIAAAKTQTPAVSGTPAPPSTEAAFFGVREVKNGRSFTLRMSKEVTRLQGIPEQEGFTVIIAGSLSLDRAGPIASSHPLVKRSMIINKGDHSVLTIGFTQGSLPAYRVTGKGAALEIVIGSSRAG